MTPSDDPLGFAKGILSLLRLVRLYDSDNVAFDGPNQALTDVSARLIAARGAIRLQADGGMIWINREPLRGGRQAFAVIRDLEIGLQALGVAEIVVRQALSRPAIMAFVDALRAAIPHEAEAVRSLQATIRDSPLEDVWAVHAHGETTGVAQVRKVQIDERTYFALAYSKTLVLLREYVTHLRHEELQRYFTQKLHRGLQEIARLIPYYAHRWLRLASLRNTDAPLYVYMQSTGLLSMLLGHALSLSKLTLTDLGIAGLLHALGRAQLPEDLRTRDQLDPEQAALVGTHPYRTLGLLLEGRSLDARTLIAATVAVHSPLHDASVPRRFSPPELHPFAHIVRVCSDYARWTSPWDDRPALLPDQALRNMVEAPKGSYDPLVLTAFANMMGLYPTGAVVSLDTGDIAVVVHPNPEHPRQPMVAVVRDADGQPADGPFIDLSIPLVDPPTPTITGSVDPQALGIVIPDYLLA